MKQLLFIFTVFISLHLSAADSALPVKFEELTSPEFPSAVAKSGKTCIIPFGILEKHGPHLPLGTDLLDVRNIALKAAEKEYAVVFPQYYVGQINEAKHQPGTIAYSHILIWQMLQETCDELHRNGFEKIIIVNGHGGNNAMLKYFCQSQLATVQDYVVLLFMPETTPETATKAKALRKTDHDGHAGESESSTMLTHHPDLVHLEKVHDQSGENLARLDHLKNMFTGIWWYARYPNHYAGDGFSANTKLGTLLVNDEVQQLINLLKVVKSDNELLNLQRQFFDDAKTPLKTKQ